MPPDSWAFSSSARRGGLKFRMDDGKQRSVASTDEPAQSVFGWEVCDATGLMLWRADWKRPRSRSNGSCRRATTARALRAKAAADGSR